MRTRTRIKICCMASLEEAQLAIRSGADAIGLVGAMPSGKGAIDEHTIAAIASKSRSESGKIRLASCNKGSGSTN